MEDRGKFRRTFEKFEKAFKKFEEIIIHPFIFDFLSEELIIEVGTKRFEYTFESLWTSIREYMRVEWIICTTPLQSFKEAFKKGIIEAEYENLFLEIIEKRNQIVHIYGFEEAKIIYGFIKEKNVYSAIDSVYKKLKEIGSN